MLMLIFRSLMIILCVLFYYYIHRWCKKEFGDYPIINIASMGVFVFLLGLIVFDICSYFTNWHKISVGEILDLDWMILWFSFVLILYCLTGLVQGGFAYFFRKKSSTIRLWELFGLMRLTTIFLAAFMYGFRNACYALAPTSSDAFYNLPVNEHGYIIYLPGRIYGITGILLLTFVALAILFYGVELLTKRFVRR